MRYTASTDLGGSVTTHVAAPPERVWNLVSDVTNVGLFSPETFDAEWLDGATGPALGVRFRGHVHRNGRGPTYWTTRTICACEPHREFAFIVGALGIEGINTWRYQLEPNGAGTDVAESFQLAGAAKRLGWAPPSRPRRARHAHGLATAAQITAPFRPRGPVRRPRAGPIIPLLRHSLSLGQKAQVRRYGPAVGVWPPAR